MPLDMTPVKLITWGALSGSGAVQKPEILDVQSHAWGTSASNRSGRCISRGLWIDAHRFDLGTPQLIGHSPASCN